jgi:hypothetical protein
LRAISRYAIKSKSSILNWRERRTCARQPRSQGCCTFVATTGLLTSGASTVIALTRRGAVVAAAFGILTTSILATEGRAESAPATLADGKAEGTLTVNGKTTTVAFAFARSVPGFFDKNVNDIQVIVSDLPLDAKAQADEFVRARMAKEGKLHAFEITIDASGAPVSTAWRHNGFKGPMPSGLSSDDVFTKKVLDGKFVEGNYKSAATEEFFGNTYAFDVTFRAVVAH